MNFSFDQAKLNTLQQYVPLLYEANLDKNIINVIEQIKNELISTCSILNLFEIFLTTSLPQLQFWSLDVIIIITNEKYQVIQPQVKNEIRNAFTKIITESLVTKVYSFPYIASKFSFCVINWLKYDYPENFSNFFNDIIQRIKTSPDPNLRNSNVTFLVDLLTIFDDELIKFRHTYSDYLGMRANIIKDYMRIHVINDILFTLLQLISNETMFEKKLVQKAIEVISQLIDWNLLSVFKDIICVLFTKTIVNYKTGCLEVMNAMVKKGMDSQSKLNVLKEMNVAEAITSIINSKEEANYLVISEIINNVGICALAGLGYVVGKSTNKAVATNVANTDISIINESKNIFAFSINAASAIISFREYKITQSFLDFIQGATYYSKNNIATFSNEMISSLVTLANSIGEALMIPKEYDIRKDLSSDQDDEFFSFRKEYSSVYANLFVIEKLNQVIYSYIFSKCSSIATMSAYEKEHVLFIIGAISQFAIKVPNNDLLRILFEDSITGENYPSVLLMYYDDLMKYLTWYIDNTTAIEFVLNKFMNKSGIINDDMNTGAKIASVLDKFVEKIRMKASHDILIKIYEVLKGYVVGIINSKNFQLIPLYDILYHTLGLICNSLSDDKKEMFFGEIMKIILDNCVSGDEFLFITMNKCLTLLFASVASEIKNQNMVTLIKNFLDVYVAKYYSLSVKTSKSAHAMITLFQRLLIIIPQTSLTYIDVFIENQFNQMSNEIFVDVTLLFISTLSALKSVASNLISKYFNKIHQFIRINQAIPTSNISDIEKHAILMYQTFAKAISIVANFDANSLASVIDFALTILIHLNDPSTRKILIRSFAVMVSNSMSNANIFRSTMNGIFECSLKLDPKNKDDQGIIMEIIKCFACAATGNSVLLNIYLKDIKVDKINEVIGVLKGLKGKVSDPKNEGIDAFNYLLNCYKSK